MRLFRERLLGSLLDKRAISQELVQKLLAWRHPGFSAHVGEPIAASDKQRLCDTAAHPSAVDLPEVLRQQVEAVGGVAEEVALEQDLGHNPGPLVRQAGARQERRREREKVVGRVPRDGIPL